MIATQLAVQSGARVLAIASAAHHERLRAWGAVPIAYGDGLLPRLQQAAPDGLDAFLDAHGHGYVELAVRLGVPKERIETIIDFDAAARLGTPAAGMSAHPDPAGGVVRLARLAAEGGLDIPIKARFPLERVRDAYREVARRSGLGKIVLDVSPA